LCSVFKNFVVRMKVKWPRKIFTVATCILKYQVFILSNGYTIKYSEKNVKIYIKINIKSAPACFGLNNHHQGAWHLCFTKVIIIKIVS
jgi:hypothetical protein